MAYMAGKKSELLHAGYTNLYGMSNPLPSHSVMLEVAYRLIEYVGMAVKSSYKFVISTFPGRGTLNTENIGPFWSPIFKIAANKLSNGDCDVAVNGSSFAKELLMDQFEKDKNVAFSRAFAAMDVWLDGLVVGTEQVEWHPDHLRLTKTSGCFPLTVHNCLDQIGHKQFDHTRQGSTGSFHSFC